MKLIEAIDWYNEEISKWPDGVSFKNKVRFLGISNDNGEMIKREILDNDNWGIVVTSLDKELIDAAEKLLRK